MVLFPSRGVKTSSSFPAEGQYGSYGYNSFGMRPPPSGDALGLGGHILKTGAGISPPPVTETEVVQPSQMMAIGETFSGGIDFLRFDLQHLEQAYNAPSRHQGKANVVFCDGHVESPTLQFLFENTSDAALVRWNRDHLPHRDRL